MHRFTWSALGLRVQEDSPDLLLAAARSFLAVTSLLAIWLDSTQPARLATMARGLLVLYVAYSGVVFLIERSAKNSARYALAVHVGDIVWAAAITSITEGPNSPFFLFFLFALIAAAYRWNMRRVIFTAAALIAVLAAQAALLMIPTVHSLLGTSYDTNRLVMRAAYLLAGSIVIGYIGDNEKRLIREAAFVGSLVSIPRAELGLKRSAHMVLSEVARFFCAPRAAILICIGGGGNYLLELGPGHNGNEWIDLTPEQAEPWLFSIAATCAWVVRSSTGKNVLDSRARWRSRKSRGELQLPLALADSHAFNDLLLAKLAMGEEWSGRIFLFDPQPPRDPISALVLLDRIVRQVAPAVNNVYLLKRIRERAQAAQRQRLAHDLHDGAIQALVAARLQLEVLHRKYVLPEEAVAELRRTQEIVRNETCKLRMIMQDLHTRSVEQPDLASNLLEVVTNFRRYSDIEVKLLWDPATLKLPVRVSREALRIIQEALLNIHKHSRAKHTVIELNNTGSELQIKVQDDGIGLEFEGCMRLADLDELHMGPRVIKQRLKDLGGTLLLESHCNAGTRLELSIPLSDHDAG